ncbi:50S ribosomal protein L32 [Haploplasma modicum]|jgi:large subunit ribosomal protein L32|uniref:50S ribosomal protein L32 n=1 Tax=Haploplasma modicum TaxID=2150 RepID=UPI000478EA31|nr:50S ribosomal protein L32 [Haploplasma modicum]MCR1808905.1 50S ribosomal protein L32 [Haploplasma modicum]
MAVPFRRTGKTATRKRRTHQKLTAPTLVVCPNTGEFTLPHRVTPNSGYYKGQLILEKKESK